MDGWLISNLPTGPTRQKGAVRHPGPYTGGCPAGAPTGYRRVGCGPQARSPLGSPDPRCQLLIALNSLTGKRGRLKQNPQIYPFLAVYLRGPGGARPPYVGPRWAPPGPRCGSGRRPDPHMGPGGAGPQMQVADAPVKTSTERGRCFQTPQIRPFLPGTLGEVFFGCGLRPHPTRPTTRGPFLAKYFGSDFRSRRSSSQNFNPASTSKTDPLFPDFLSRYSKRGGPGVGPQGPLPDPTRTPLVVRPRGPHLYTGGASGPTGYKGAGRSPAPRNPEGARALRARAPIGWGPLGGPHIRAPRSGALMRPA